MKGFVGVVLVVIGAIVLGLLLLSGLRFGIPSGQPSSLPFLPTAIPAQAISKEEYWEYFSAITFHKAGNKDSSAPLERWTKSPVTIELTGEINDEVIANLDSIIEAFNVISKTVKLERIEHLGDLIIHFVSRDEMLAKRGRGEEQILGWAHINTDSSCTIGSADIYLQNQVKDRDYALHSSLVHELSHALGFEGHDYGKRGCNALTSIACAPLLTYTPYDTFAIKVLYNSGIPLCSSETEAKIYLDLHWPQ